MRARLVRPASRAGSARAAGGAPPTWTTGELGSALAFGNNAYVHVPDDPTFDLPAAFTITFWAKPIANPNDNQPRVLSREVDVKFNGKNPQIGFAGKFCISTYEYVAQEWQHFAVVFEGGAKWYVDGAATPVGSCTFTGAETVGATTSPLLFGALSPTENFYYGALDDVRMYGVALTAAEIATIAAER